MNLIQQLSVYFPDWRKHYSNPLDAAASIGLLDDDEETPRNGELDFDHKVYWEGDDE